MEAIRLFGESELSAQVFKLPPGRWAGPFRSGYGWHLVYVTRHWPSSLPTLAEVHERALADYLAEQRRLLNIRAFENLRAKYNIVHDGERR